MEKMMTQTITQSLLQIRVTNHTIFKAQPIQSSELEADQKISVLPGTYNINNYEERGNHLLIDLAIPLAGQTQWYVFVGHIDRLTIAPYPPNTDKAEDNKEGILKLPGYNQIFSLSDPIINQGNFTWAEATKNGTRIPESKQLVDNIILMAEKMQEVREFLGGTPITITSWYRDPATNRRVGGAIKSTHILGYGVDFHVRGMTPRQVQNRLESYWEGGLGYGHRFTHLDLRSYKARWNYSG